jgi:hypothetical protein
MSLMNEVLGIHLNIIPAVENWYSYPIAEIKLL